MRRRSAVLALLVPVLALAPRAAVAQSRVLDEYVTIGLAQNLALRQQSLASDRSDAVVREARGNFLPSATLNARYTDFRGSGVDFGAFINPVFATLNQLTGTSQFPTNVNVRLPLRQETTVRVAQPVFAPAILAGYRAANAARDAQDATRDAAIVQVAAEIRSAYLQHAKARRLAELRAATRTLLEEQVRVMTRLIEAGRATPDALSRARAELSEAVQLQAESGQLASASAQAFNMMLARALTDTVLVDEDTLGFGPLPSLEDAIARGARERPELRALGAAERAATAQRRAVQANYLPNLAVALDYGFQGNEYRFASDADYTSLSVVASWNLFNGGRDAARAEQAALDARRYAVQGDEARRGVELQVRLAWQAAAVARAAIATAEDQRAAAARTHDLVRRRAEEGLASPLELSQARTQLTAAELNAVFTSYDYYLRRVELDRAAALYPRATP
ncbi:MAG: TolC family protein [Gemmatimonadetes bacterium]|jgi:outer membrane protein|nr:TolC family protein [Gemmatimonadota bacterium]MBP7548819.1 TolC family protein [Gemmatimonadaceae bacterium]